VEADTLDQSPEAMTIFRKVHGGCD